MTTQLEPGSTILFTGDSVTDCGRREDAGSHLGFGYVRAVASSSRTGGARILNTGISGNRIVDLEPRWRAEVLAPRADVVSILIGINDTWRRYDENQETAASAFEAGYRRLLDALAATGAQIVLVEPFLLPVSAAQRVWREDLDPKIDVVRRLAADYDAILVPADVELTRQAADLPAGSLADDGVHPTELGHARLAELWLDTVVGRA